jgi:kanamycin kinase
MQAPGELPTQVTAMHDGWDIHLVQAPYMYATWRLSRDHEVRYAKIARAGVYPSLLAEADRMRWARRYLPIPEVVDAGTSDGVEWLVTIGLPGDDCTKLTNDPEAIVPIFARGLRAFHDAAPVADCPFDFRLDAALEHCAYRVPTEKEQWDDLHGEYKHMTPRQVLQELFDTRPSSEDLVVCHGDYCFPNVLVVDGRATGYLDLGELGVADRWWDLAVGTWTCDWNVGPGWQDLFLEAYGVERDDARIRYYRLMYDLAS